MLARKKSSVSAQAFSEPGTLDFPAAPLHIYVMSDDAEGLPEKRANSAGKPRSAGVPFKQGYDPRRGHGPEKGHGGRPTNAYVLRMAGLADLAIPEEILQPIDPAVADLLQRRHPAVWTMLMHLRLEAWLAVSDRSHGRPALGAASESDAARREKLRGMSSEELIAALRFLDAQQAEAEEVEEPEVGDGPGS